MAAGTRTITIKFDGTAKGLVAATGVASAQLRALEQQTETNRKNLGKFTSAVNSTFGALARGALAISNLSGGIAVVMGLTTALIAMSGAAGLIPAAMFGAAAAMIAVKLGGEGIQRAFEGLGPTLDGLKAKVSDSFEKSLTPAVNNLKVALPQLTGGFQQIATAMGGVLTKITAWLKTPAAIGQVNTILSATARVIQNIGAFLAPVIAAFVRIGAVAAPILVELTSGLGAVGERFKAWVDRMAETGNIEQWIRNAIEAFRELFAILGDIGGIVSAVFGALSDAGVGLGGVLGPVIKQVREFVESAEGHDAIVALAQAVGTVGQAVSGVLGAALKAIAPALPPLLDAFAQLATQVAAFLVPAIQTLGPLLQGLALFLSQNMTWIGPLVIAIGGLALGIQAVTTAVNLWKAAVAAYTVVQWALNAAMTASPIGLIIAGIAALIAVIVLIVSNLDFFRGVWDAVWKFVSDVITAVVGWFRDRWNDVWGWFTGLLGGLGGFFSGIWNGARNIVGGVIDWFRGAWDGAVSAVRGFFSGLADFAGGIWGGIVSGVKSAINSVIRVVNGAIGGVNNITGVVGIPAIPSIPYLAKGGTARAGQSYLVGERGPELFTPGRTGRVTNANTTAEAIGGGAGGAEVLELHLDLGEGISQVVQIQLERRDRQTRRALTAGVGAAR
ncbi:MULTISPECIES: phage tail protein [Amycolatopsis]|uniref:phage tail protein n=1 Tax=Amycolatopsis TaxID=1813 RepID=UPI000B8B70C5|nr:MULTISPECIES: hypothetical protein [Amycolatopsis]OXM73090.1 hypothetical protein CF166_11245 [Amycolatopsis sp. KNN50.9b]